jgi:methylglutaconyl-CoA hydratase
MENLIKKIDTRGVASVVLNRPQVHNAFDEELILSLTNTFLELDKDPKVRLATLSGEGPSFCAGADLNWMKKMVNYSEEQNLRDAQELARLFTVLSSFSKPLLAKVEGHILGGGVGLVSICDFVLASEKAVFGLTEVTLGLIPAVISPYVLAKINPSFARAYFTSGMKFDALEAKNMGLVHQITPPENLDGQFEDIVSSFLRAGPRASFLAKALIKKIVPPIDPNIIYYTCETIADIRISPEAQEGMNALLNKKKPAWVGHHGD